MKQKHRHYGYIVLILLIVAIILASIYFPNLKELTSPTSVRTFLLQFGILSSLAFVVILLLAVPLPIPSTPIILAGGYVYGTIVGSVLALIAVLIGSSISFWLVRKYGQPLLKKLVDHHHIEHFNHIFKKRGWIVAFISYVVPIFPSDGISALLGFTKMRYRTFLLLVIAGHIPRFLIINSLGEDLFSGFSMKTIIVLILTSILILIAVFREPIKRFFFKELKTLKKDIKIVEEDIEYIEEGLGMKKSIKKEKNIKNIKLKNKKQP